MFFEFLGSYLVPPFGITLIGGVLLLTAFRLVGIVDLSFLRCWVIYVAAFLYGCLAAAVLGLLLRWRGVGSGDWVGLYIALTWAVHALAVPLLSRLRALRVVVAEQAAIVLTNLICLAFAFPWRHG